MNAHINYDLAQVVFKQQSSVGPRNYKPDYDRINDAIANCIGPASDDLGSR